MDYKLLTSNDKITNSKNQTNNNYADYTDNYENFNNSNSKLKKQSNKKYNNIMITTLSALSLSMCAIGLSSITYNNYKKLDTKVNTLTYDYSSYSSSIMQNNLLTSKMLQVQQGVSSMISGHPLCGLNYSDCMNLMHVASHIASHNFTMFDIISDKYSLGNSNLMILSNNGNVLGHSSGLSNVDVDLLNKIHHELPAPENCHHYAYGTCLFTRGDHLMFYSHVIFNNNVDGLGYEDSITKRSMDDIFSYGSSGAGMGSAIGGGLSIIAGPEAIPVGAAIGGAIGAIVGGTIGAFQ